MFVSSLSECFVLLCGFGRKKRCGARQARPSEGTLERDPTKMAAIYVILALLSAAVLLLPLHLLTAAARFLRIIRVQAPEMPADEDTKFYHDDPAWKDIEPIPQDDGGLHPLAAIAYTDEYSEAMGYLRAVMAKNEYSQRVLELTEHIISMNPAHYTVW